MTMTNILISHTQITDTTPIPHALCPTPDAERDQRFPLAECACYGRQVPSNTQLFVKKRDGKMGKWENGRVLQA
jgi:hypothetical protein